MKLVYVEWLAAALAAMLLTGALVSCGLADDTAQDHAREDGEAGTPLPGCEKDTDCKGERICRAGDCVYPGPVDGDADGEGGLDGDGESGEIDLSDSPYCPPGMEWSEENGMCLPECQPNCGADGEAGDGDVAPDGDSAPDGDGPADGDSAIIDPGLTWISIPAGSFQMGCAPRDTNCEDCEKPRHPVDVSAFKMTQTEITQDQYDYVTGESPSYFSSCGGNCPVERVNWSDARAFCAAVGGRLPSEAEFEYATRAGTETVYYNGDDSSDLGRIAWYSANSNLTTHPAKRKLPNDFGLYDMTGNVWEWTQDCWHVNYDDAPSTGEVWDGGDCSYRMLRGGCWDNDVDYGMSASFRSGTDPRRISSITGFRCARDAN